jgi:hypothetical protein
MYPIGTNKSEWEAQAKEIVAGKVIATPIELISWLQDMNWPGAHIIANYLHSLPNPQIAEAIKMVLESNDEMWIYWINEVWSQDELNLILKTTVS